MITYKKEFGPKEREAILEISLRDRKYKMAQLKQQCLCVLAAGLIFIGGALMQEIWICCLGAFILIAGILLLPVLNKSKARKAYRNADPRVFSGVREYRVDQTGIEITSFAGTSRNLWESMVSCGEYKDFIWIMRADRQALLFDKTILSEQELLELRVLIKEHIAASK